MAEESLIPKKTTISDQNMAGFGIFFRIAVVFFVVAVVIVGSLFLYKSILQGNLTKGEAALKSLESQFPIETIDKHEEVATAIAVSQKLLAGHLKQSDIFTFLEENTLQSIAYGSFSFAENDHKVTISGEAPSYQAVAQQANVFEQLDKVSSATFSNLSLGSKGTVVFSLTILFKDSFLVSK